MRHLRERHGQAVVRSGKKRQQRTENHEHRRSRDAKQVWDYHEKCVDDRLSGTLTAEKSFSSPFGNDPATMMAQETAVGPRLSTMIQTNGLTRNFGNFVAVHDLNLQVAKGVIFGFLGPNGSGKSTTVKMLTGILKPSAGEALIDGLSIKSSPIEIKRKI